MKFTVAFSNKHDNEFGVNYQNKIVRVTSDETTGMEFKETYYFWGKKQLQGEIDLDPSRYIVKEKEVVIDTDEGQKMVTLKQFVGLK